MSTAYDWLVVSGAKAQYKGLASVNGEAGYGFLLTALDGERKRAGEPDRLRLKVWNVATGEIVYDNQEGADSAEPTTAINGGQITVSRP